MKKLLQLIALASIINANAQIGGGWDWAFNTGSLGGTTYKHLKYTTDGSEIMMGGQALAAAYFGSNTLTAPPQGSFAGNIKFFGKINAATGIPTIIRSFINIPINFDCITTDDAGNFYIGGAFVAVTDFDLGNGVIIPASAFKMSVIAKFDAAGNTLWAKTFAMGTLGSASTQIFKLAVSPAGNVFFWGWNNGATNYPLYKLDSNGNTLWFKNATGTGIGTSNNEAYLRDKFIDNDENVHLFLYGTGTAGFTFDGVSRPGGSASYGYSTLISVNAAGNVTNGQTFDGGVSHFQVNRTNGNLAFGWNQFYPNPGAFQNLPHPLASLIPSYANAFNGMMETDKNLNFIKAKDYSTTVDNPFSVSLNNDMFLSLPNGKMLIATDFYKTVAYYVGVNSLYPADPTKYGNVIIETDTNWSMEKFISGGKAPGVQQTYLSAYNDTYLLGSGFYAEEPCCQTANPPLPTTSFGTVNLTGFNAASNMTTAYGTFSTSSSLRYDVALAQCKSGNFPTIASTTWLGLTNNWNTISNWSNGVPTASMKALFATATTNFPTLATSPTAATLEVNAGVDVVLPSTIVLLGGLKNNGNITFNNAGFFAGLGTNEWKGSGSVTFSGSQASFNYSKVFTNGLVLNTNLNAFQNLNVPTLAINAAKLNLNNKKLSITSTNPMAITGTNATSYIYGGTVERNINTNGTYEFPLGDATFAQTVIISANNLVGTNKLSATFTNGAITGTVPNTTFNSVSITSALNGGWFSINPNVQPVSGSYDVTLKIQNSSNTSPTVGNYTIIKRDNSTSPWSVLGNYNLGSTAAGIVSVTNSNLNSFSDFAIGKGVSDITLGNVNFSKSRTILYPNPVTNQLNLSFENQLDNATLRIISITGQTVLERKNISGLEFSIEISNLNSGLYMMQVLDKNNVNTVKFIKH